MQLRNGATFEVVVTAQDVRRDCTWLQTVEPIKDLPFCVLSGSIPPNGTKVAHAGFGVDNPGNTEYGEVTGQPNTNDRDLLQVRISYSSGDSGGATYRVDNGQVVGVACCTSSRGSLGNAYAGNCVRLWQMAREAKLWPVMPEMETFDDFGFAPKEIPSCTALPKMVNPD